MAGVRNRDMNFVAVRVGRSSQSVARAVCCGDRRTALMGRRRRNGRFEEADWSESIVGGGRRVWEPCGVSMFVFVAATRLMDSGYIGEAVVENLGKRELLLSGLVSGQVQRVGEACETISGRDFV